MSFIKQLFNQKAPTQPSPTGSPQSKCPYCKAELQPVPTRKKKCPHCSQYIYVRQKELLTEDDAKIYEWLGRLSSIGIDRQVFDQHRDALSRQFGFRAPVNDTLWRIFTELKRQKRPHHDRMLISSYMAQILREEGKDPSPCLADAAREELLDYKETGVKFVEVGTVNDQYVCQNCKNLASQVFSIDQALSQMPVPHSCESKYGCRCSYLPVVKR